MSNTPETDLLLSDQHHDCVPFDDSCGQLAEKCKKLERERDEAREALRVLAEQLTSRTTSPDPDTAWWNLKQAHQRALELLQEAAK